MKLEEQYKKYEVLYGKINTVHQNSKCSSSISNDKSSINLSLYEINKSIQGKVDLKPMNNPYLINPTFLSESEQSIPSILLFLFETSTAFETSLSTSNSIND